MSARAMLAALLLMAGGVAIAVLVREAGVGAVLSALVAAGAWLPVVLLLECAIAVADVRVVRALYGEHASRAPADAWLRGALLAVVAAQALPGGRVVGEALRAMELAPQLGRMRAALVASMAQGAHVLVVSIASLVCAGSVVGSSATLAGALVLIAAWTALLGMALVLAPRSARFALAAARRFVPELAASEASIRATPGLTWTSRALAWALAARALHVAQAGVALFAIAGSLDARAAFALEGLEILAANAGDAVPGQAGVLEACARAFAPLLATSLGSAVAIALVLRVGRVGLAISAALVLSRRTTRVAASAAALLLACLASSPVCAQVDVVARQRVVGAIGPSGAEHMIAVAARESWAREGDLLTTGAGIEGGLVSYVSPVDAMSGGYVQVTPLAFLVLRAEVLSVGVWPIGMDGAGYYPMRTYTDDIGNLPAAQGGHAAGIDVQLGATLQLAVTLGALRPIFLAQVTAELQRLGQESYHYSPRYDTVLAREDWMLAGTGYAMLELALDAHVALRLGAYDDLRAVPRSGYLSHVLGPVAMLALTELDAALPELLVVIRAGAHLDESRRAGEWTGLAAIALTYRAGAL